MLSAGFEKRSFQIWHVAKSLYFVFNLFTLNTKLKYWRTLLNALTFHLAENPYYV